MDPIPGFVTVYGFTGTQRGMTAAQVEVVRGLLTGPADAHHGDCVGADADFHALAVEAGCRVVIHPPENPSKRAWCAGDEVLPVRPYLDRNHDIVKACDVLIATPGGMQEELRSGTWATVRYGRKTGVRVLVVFPDGTVEESAARA